MENGVKSYYATIDNVLRSTIFPLFTDTSNKLHTEVSYVFATSFKVIATDRAYV